MAEPTTMFELLLTILEALGFLLLILLVSIVVAILLITLVTATRSIWWDRVVPVAKRWLDWIYEKWN